jgi:hypothetical protein
MVDTKFIGATRRAFGFGVTAGEVVTATATRLVPDPNAPTTLLPTDTSEFSAGRSVE